MRLVEEFSAETHSAQARRDAPSEALDKRVR